MAANEFIRIENLHAWYGESHVLHGVNMHVNEGEVVSVLGRNGAGRTTTMRAIVGLTGARTGSIRIKGTEAIKLPPHRVARLGVGCCGGASLLFGTGWLTSHMVLLLGCTMLLAVQLTRLRHPPAIASGGAVLCGVDPLAIVTWVAIALCVALLEISCLKAPAMWRRLREGPALRQDDH